MSIGHCVVAIWLVVGVALVGSYTVAGANTPAGTAGPPPTTPALAEAPPELAKLDHPEMAQPLDLDLSSGQLELARVVASEYANDLGDGNPQLRGLEVAEIGSLSDESGLFGAAVTLRLPEYRTVERLPQIDLRRTDSGYVSTEYTVNATNLRLLVALVRFDTESVIGLSVRPEAGVRVRTENVGPVPSMPEVPGYHDNED